MTQADPRRSIPRTDSLLALPVVQSAAARLGSVRVQQIVRQAADDARSGVISPAAVATEVEARLGHALTSSEASRLRPVLNATGVIVHTNLGRAPLSAAAVAAITDAASYVNVEFDLATGQRASRGAEARQALLAACPAAEDALVVNNGAAALVLAATALAVGREIVISRGELIEIGAGFRLPELIVSTGARLREIGATNRTHLHDYADAIGDQTGYVLKVHPSNYQIHGFTSTVDIPDLNSLVELAGLPLIVDIGSGLLAPDSELPAEPDATTALLAGADLVIASGDKLLGGPQAGIILGRSVLVTRLAKHPLARAVRADKLALAALAATLVGPPPPVTAALHANLTLLRQRTDRLAAALGVPVVAHEGRVGGGAGPGHPLPGWALRLPEGIASHLRSGDPAVVARVHASSSLIDLRCIPEGDDEVLLAAIQAALHA